MFRDLYLYLYLYLGFPTQSLLSPFTGIWRWRSMAGRFVGYPLYPVPRVTVRPWWRSMLPTPVGGFRAHLYPLYRAPRVTVRPFCFVFVLPTVTS